MQLIRKYSQEIRYFLCAIDLLSKYAFVVPLKDKKGTTIANAFKVILKSQIKYGQTKAVSFITLIL